MFGPDKCGSANNKIHFILQHQNPLNASWEEKHFNNTAAVKMDKKSHLYTLVLRADNTFETFIDMKSSREGNLLTHMRPPINPPKEIDDPTDKKPSDWIDEATVEDPHAVKPDDWDEAAPRVIPDPKAVKPEGWLDDAPLEIPDPAARKPEDWEDEEDGIWEAPSIPNPACEKAGCGEWVPPTIKNPAFKGPWNPPHIPNPNYKGEWKPRQIPNKDYFFDGEPAKGLAPMAGIAVEVWTINGGIHFDNFLVAESQAAAFAFADTTFKQKSEMEGKKEKKEKKETQKKNRETMIQSGTPLEKAEAYFTAAMEVLVDFYSENAWAIPVTVLALVAGVFMLLPKGPRKKPTEEVVVEESKEEENEEKPGNVDSDATPQDQSTNETKDE